MELEVWNEFLFYFFYIVEINWLVEYMMLIYVIDLVVMIENMYDVILLGVKRVGYGIGFLSYFFLME